MKFPDGGIRALLGPISITDPDEVRTFLDALSFLIGAPIDDDYNRLLEAVETYMAELSLNELRVYSVEHLIQWWFSPGTWSLPPPVRLVRLEGFYEDHAPRFLSHHPDSAKYFFHTLFDDSTVIVRNPALVVWDGTELIPTMDMPPVALHILRRLCCTGWQQLLEGERSAKRIKNRHK